MAGGVRGGSTTGVLAAVMAGAIAVVSAFAAPADAKATYESPYGYERTWTAALRFVRVDNGWKVTEKDEASGYLLFEYLSPENAKPVAASLELVRAPGDGGATSVVVRIAQMPRYHEQVLLDGLSAKMRREYGDPPPARPHPPEPLPEDAGTAD